jgi:hypothetical protein
MKGLEVRGAVRPQKRPLGVKWLILLLRQFTVHQLVNKYNFDSIKML